VIASHCNLLIGRKKELKVGDIATLIGPDHPDITPEGFARLIKGHNYLQNGPPQKILSLIKQSNS
jgi:alanine racemase